MQSFFLPVLRLLAVGPLLPCLLEAQVPVQRIRLFFRRVDSSKKRFFPGFQMKLHKLRCGAIRAVSIVVYRFTITCKA